MVRLGHLVMPENKIFSKTEGLMSKNMGGNMAKGKKFEYPKHKANAVEYIKTQKGRGNEKRKKIHYLVWGILLLVRSKFKGKDQLSPEMGSSWREY